MVRILYLLFLGLLIFSKGLAQDTTNELSSLVEENSHLIESIDPADSTYTDFEFLTDELESVNIVMLGEQAHGDGSTFLAKTRLIKYLHEELNYDVLVFESGLFDMYRTWEKIKDGADSLSVFDYGVFPIWARSHQVQALFQYILDQSKTSNPLIVAGFDIQPTGSRMNKNDRIVEITSYLKKSIDYDEESYPLFAKSFQNLGYVMQNPLDKEAYNAVKEEYIKLQERILNADKTEEGLLYARYIDNYFKTLTLYTKADLQKPTNTPHAFNIRDREMARNFEFLSSYLYPGEKFIVWGANSHLGYGRGLLDDFMEMKPSAPAMIPFGQYLKIDHQEELYTISFTSFAGSIGLFNGTERELPSGHEDSLEKLLSQKEGEYHFLSLKADGFKSLRFPARIYGHAEMSGIWGQMTDGIFFIRNMEPNKLD
jgi:erythromycin esterase